MLTPQNNVLIKGAIIYYIQWICLHSIGTASHVRWTI